MSLPWEHQETIRLLKGAPGTMYQESDEVNRAIFRDWIRSLLQTQEVTITFLKADGAEREMLCTLNHDKIQWNPTSTATLSENAKERKKNNEVLSVWDVNKREWRSFRFDRLKKIHVDLNFE
jgi:hypothetical protein